MFKGGSKIFQSFSYTEVPLFMNFCCSHVVFKFFFNVQKGVHEQISKMNHICCYILRNEIHKTSLTLQNDGHLPSSQKQFIAVQNCRDQTTYMAS